MALSVHTTEPPELIVAVFVFPDTSFSVNPDPSFMGHALTALQVVGAEAGVPGPGIMPPCAPISDRQAITMHESKGFIARSSS
jgi:hypothetical protein